MDYAASLEKIEHFAITTTHHHHKKELLYHNQQHTERVVKAAIKIGQHYNLNEADMFIITAAAWFHDLGYCMGAATGHEDKGAEMAAGYLKELGVDDATIQAIRGCILATRMPQHPITLLEKIVCDADLYHLGTDEFAEGNKLVRKEYEAVHDIRISKEDWRVKAIGFLTTHQYHTDYARQLLETKKQENIAMLQKKVDEYREKENGRIDTASNGNSRKSADDDDEDDDNDMPERKKHADDRHEKKPDKPSRGIETMFRVTSSNHQRLSDMADNKAHILITVNSIILSAIITLLLRKIDDHSYLLIPTILILAVCLITLTFAILATRPSIPDGRFTKEDIEKKRTNLLFFGNFYRMDLESYNEGMQKMMEDTDFLYGSLIKDVYAQGIVLGKKYHLLRIAYNVFMFGLIIAVAAYVIASVITQP